MISSSNSTILTRWNFAPVVLLTVATGKRVNDAQHEIVYEWNNVSYEFFLFYLVGMSYLSSSLNASCAASFLLNGCVLSCNYPYVMCVLFSSVTH